MFNPPITKLTWTWAGPKCGEMIKELAQTVSTKGRTLCRAFSPQIFGGWVPRPAA